jgi:hypothetical protein
MFAEVRKEFSFFTTVSDRAKANFKVKGPTLEPWPIMGMGL